jgi:hypothetical protein
MRNWRHRFKSSGLRVGQRWRLLHEAIGVRTRRRRGPASAKPSADHGGRLRGRYSVRALLRAALAGLAHPRYTAKRSRGTAENTTASGSELIDLVMQKAQQLKDEVGCSISGQGQPKSPTVMETLAEIISSPSSPIRQDKKPKAEPVRVAPARLTTRNGSRSPIASANLESAITEAIRKRAPGCESFVGVIVQPTRPKSRFDTNWTLRGVKFGKADREKVIEAIATIVESMQREFSLADD